MEVYTPTYYVVFDQDVADDWGYLKDQLGRTIPFVYKGWIERSIDPVHPELEPIVGAIPVTGELLSYPDDEMYTSTTTTQCLKLAYWMGFTTVYFVGCDWGNPRLHHRGMTSYDRIDKVRPITHSIISRHTEELELALKMWTDDGRELYNLSPGTEMPVIPKETLEIL